MFLKIIKTNGVIRLYFYESFYEPGRNKGERGQIRQRAITSLGILDELKKKFNDPIMHFTEIARQHNLKQRENSRVSVDIDFNLSMSEEDDSIRNIGYGILNLIYKKLDLDKFWKAKMKKEQIQTDIEAVFCILVMMYTLFPEAKDQISDKQHIFFRQSNAFSRENIYFALPFFSDFCKELQRWIFDRTTKICDRDLSTCYLIFTNYNLSNSKIGLLIDKNGLPLSYYFLDEIDIKSIYTSSTVSQLKSEFSRIIFVADQDLHSPVHHGYPRGLKQEDGYFYTQALSNLSAEFKNWILEERGYHIKQIKDQNDHNVQYKYKSRIQSCLSRNILADQKANKQVKKQKQMVFYTEKLASKQRIARGLMVSRAKDIIRHPAQYNKLNTAGAETYIKNIEFDKTGNIISGTQLLLNTDKIIGEEKYDGYYLILTSELNMSDKVMGELYQTLIQLGEIFDFSQSDLLLPSSFMTTEQYINSHFAICYTSLILIRLLQKKLGNQYSVATIVSSLRKYSCVQIAANTFQFTYFDKVLRSCEEAFGIKLDHKYRNRLQIRRMLKY